MSVGYTSGEELQIFISPVRIASWEICISIHLISVSLTSIHFFVANNNVVKNYNKNAVLLFVFTKNLTVVSRL